MMLNIFLTYRFALILSEAFPFHSVAFKFGGFNFTSDFFFKVPAEKLEGKHTTHTHTYTLGNWHLEMLLPNDSGSTGFKSNILVYICS